MAALCTGSYGLSQNCTDDSKQYFFVKLTDSAYRAIEDYERNQNKYSTQAKIQISENGGVISFPTTKENAGQQFTFAIDEIEGSLECIQQKKTQLDVLGTLQYKMRIHANDDVYETTRHRMAVAEETQKKKSTVEIKPNQTDIGRRVKLKHSNNRFSNITSKRDLINSTSTATFPNSTTSPNSLSSNLLVNGIGPTISSLSPPTVATNYQLHNSVPSYSGAATLGTSSGHVNDLNSISVVNTNTSSIGLSSTQNSKNNLSNNTLNNLANSSTKYLQFYNNNTNIINNRSSSNNGKSNSLPTAASSLSSALSSAAGSGTSGITGSYFNNTNNNNSVRTTTGLNTGNNSINGAGSRKHIVSTVTNSKNNSRHNSPDIKKRAIRERLIHMLALKNFKKPEIYARLQNEGIRDKEKVLVSTILKEISILRDNTFNLKHQIWNEVNEEWPFYTEQEVQILKRRKPQNLTPPLSSDGGSSTSGQSPTSTHNGSPPPTVKRPSIDRGSYYEEPTAKKQRISHFKKDGNDFSSSNNSRLQPDTDVNLMGLSYSVLGTEAARRISPRDVTLVNGQNILCQQQLNTNLNHHQNSNPKINSVNCKNTNSFLSTNTNICGNMRQKSPSSHNHNISISNSSSNSSLHSNNNNNNNNINNNNINEINISNIKARTMGGDNQQPESSLSKNEPRSSVSTDNSANRSSINCGNKDSGSSSWMSFDRASTINNDLTVEDSTEDTRSNSEDMSVSESNHSFDFSRFKKITTLEQRRKYKTEFGNDYDEYRKLLNEIDSVRTRFNVLAQQLHNARNNDANYRSIKRQIIDEYQRIQNQREHQNVKARFNYLHGKLAHIKKLVNEFDKTLTTTDTTAELPLSSELSDSTTYRNRSPVSSSVQNYDISGNYDTSSSRSNLICDNSDGRTGNSNDSVRGSNSNYSGKINSTTLAGSSSPSNSIHKTGGTPPPSFLGSTTTYHLPKNENY